MSQTQSIIVYRNPLEQQLWEGISDGSAFPIVAACILGLATFVAIHRLSVAILARTKVKWHNRNAYATWIASVAGLTAGILSIVVLS